MRAHRWLVVALAATIAASVFPSCSGDVGTSTGSGGGGSSAHSSSSSSGTGGEADAGPIVCKSTYSTFPKGECDVLQQDCPLGKTCKPVQLGADYTTKCVLSSGLKTSGEPCYGDTECDAKLFCVGGLLDSKCAAVCCDDIKDFCNGGTCNYTFGFQNSDYFMKICRYATECTLLTEHACEPGLDCHVEDRLQGLATCGSSSNNPSPELGECEFLNDCGDMQDCFATSGKGHCYYYCYLDDMGVSAPGLGGCPQGERCVNHLGGALIDYHIPNIGLCVPDPDAGTPDAGTPDASDAGDAGDAGDDAGDAADDAGNTTDAADDAADASDDAADADDAAVDAGVGGAGAGGFGGASMDGGVMGAGGAPDGG